MDDPELEAIRQQRMQQMQGGNPDQQKAMQEQRQAQEEMKNAMLVQLLDQDARARLNTLKLSKPEKAQMVEGMIIRMAQTRQIGDKLDDASLVKLLESLNQQMPRSNSTVKFDRRRAALDSDDDDDDYGI
ncbi:programmed cell death protein 5 [Anopheles arabiensis]|uniref:AGAP005432-PA n=6 Tax=gambiae species complex TaxID=44542 RepID=Q7Q791_ANOGA|nr:programmed cell death protein 5 [Anopheles arabiensis]XP_040229925.2 programmed cell death protein 5 [Anopheles coluzzii]XP_041774449.1 programmed cell death protein 5 [Anopheles merus]XP_315439.4 programmed cell death protein 5 [Anopheles gambiae]EAA11945.4 AGAP005432-PA [Anopheles gambiae str. PEST]